MKKDSTSYIVTVVVGLCLVCSAVVSIAAIGLRDKQQANETLERNANLLTIAGLLDANQPITLERVNQLLQDIDTVVVDLRSGSLASDIDAMRYNQLDARKDPAQSSPLIATDDIASIGSREHYGSVYVVKDSSGTVDGLVLPVRGYGLWSTMYGFIALEKDLNTVRGFGFYQQGETPGLGGEVDNPKWKAQWKGKELFDPNGKVIFAVAKGASSSINKVDGLSGATLTSRGVENLIKFWLGDQGYGPFIAKLRTQEITL